MFKPDPKAPVPNEHFDSAIQSITKLLDRILTRLDSHDNRLGKLEAGQKHMQRKLSDLNTDTPTQKEFDTLQSRVNRYHPTNWILSNTW